MNNSQPTEQGANQAPGLTLNLLPAGLSLLCPGLGQLIQGRKTFILHLGIYALQVLSPLLLFYDGVTHDIRLIGNAVFFKAYLVNVLWLIPFLLIFPFFTVLFSALDAAIWKPGQSSPLARRITILAILTPVYFVFSFFIPGLLIVEPAREADRMMQCGNHLKHIALAFHNYHDHYHSFPPAYTVDKNGKPLHSWRVLLLPFLEEQKLYDQIRLEEPWDSEYNKQFHDKIPHTFRCPTSDSFVLLERKINFEKTNRLCYYSVVIGDETPFPGAASTRIRDILDGTSNTILVVERPLPVCWMDPNHEIRYDTAAKGTNRDLFGIGSVHPGGANVVFADGSVHLLSETLCLGIMQRLLIKTRGDWLCIGCTEQSH